MRVFCLIVAVLLFTGSAYASDLNYTRDEFTGIESWQYDFSQAELSNAWKYDAILEMIVQRDEEGWVLLRIDYVHFGDDWLFPGNLRGNIYEGMQVAHRVSIPVGRFDDYTMGFQSEVLDHGDVMEHGSYLVADNGWTGMANLMSVEMLHDLQYNYAKWRLEECAGILSTTEDIWYSPDNFSACIDKYLRLIGERDEIGAAADHAAASIKRGARNE